MFNLTAVEDTGEAVELRETCELFIGFFKLGSGCCDEVSKALDQGHGGLQRLCLRIVRQVRRHDRQGTFTQCDGYHGTIFQNDMAVYACNLSVGVKSEIRSQGVERPQFAVRVVLQEFLPRHAAEKEHALGYEAREGTADLYGRVDDLTRVAVGETHGLAQVAGCGENEGAVGTGIGGQAHELLAVTLDDEGENRVLCVELLRGDLEIGLIDANGRLVIKLAYDAFAFHGGNAQRASERLPAEADMRANVQFFTDEADGDDAVMEALLVGKDAGSIQGAVDGRTAAEDFDFRTNAGEGGKEPLESRSIDGG